MKEYLYIARWTESYNDETGAPESYDASTWIRDFNIGQSIHIGERRHTYRITRIDEEGVWIA